MYNYHILLQMGYSQTDLTSLKGIHGMLVFICLVTVGQNEQKSDTAFLSLSA